MQLSEKELTIIDSIGDNTAGITQRQIAEHAVLSLGMTNIILKKLAKTGYIKIKQLTAKKMQYILTGKGMSEKAKKSYQYIFKTISEIRRINDSIRNLLLKEYQSGARKIAVLGNNEISEMVKLFMPNMPDAQIIWLDGYEKGMQGMDVVLDCNNGNEPKVNYFSSRTIKVADFIINNQKE